MSKQVKLVNRVVLFRIIVKSYKIKMMENTSHEECGKPAGIRRFKKWTFICLQEKFQKIGVIH